VQEIEHKLYAYNLSSTSTVTYNSQILLTDYFIHKYYTRAVLTCLGSLGSPGWWGPYHPCGPRGGVGS